MLKSLYFILATISAVVTNAYPVPPGCIPSHVGDLPGIQCPVVDPLSNRLVLGPFVPFKPYVDWAHDFQNVHHQMVTSQVNQFQNWQLNEFDRYRAYWDNSPFPKPYGYEYFMDNQRDWLDYHQQLQNVNLKLANEARQYFLNGNRPPPKSSPESSSP